MSIAGVGPKKKCATCREAKDVTEFHRAGDGYQAYCKPCRKAWDAAYWKQNRAYRIDKQRERRQEIRSWVRDLKNSGRCADCRNSFHWTAMTYDHLPGSTKKGNVGDLVAGGYRRVLIDEIAKCDLVCANCHAVRTFIRSLGIEPTAPSICEQAPAYGTA